MMGKLDSNDSYFDRLYELFNYTKSTLGLYDSSAHLYYRDPSYIYPAKKTPGGGKVFWSRGNGWALAALARILPQLPANDPARAVIRHGVGDERALRRSSDDGLEYDLYDLPLPRSGSGTAIVRLWDGLGIMAVDKPLQTGGSKAWNAMVTQPCIRTATGIRTGRPPATDTCNGDARVQHHLGAGFFPCGSEVMKMAVDGDKYEVDDLAASVSPGDSQEDVGDVWASGEKYSRGVLSGVGDYIQYSAWLPAPGTYNVKIRFGKGADLGRWQFYKAGTKVGVQQDAYSNAFAFQGQPGQCHLQTSGNKVFRFSDRRNNASSGYLRPSIMDAHQG
jgi:hypothetical protein